MQQHNEHSWYQFLGMSVLCEYATATYFGYCRIASFTYYSKVCKSQIFSAQIGISGGNFNTICFYYLFLLGFVTSTIWLPTERHHPCVWTPVEGDEVLKQFCTIFPPHIWCFAVCILFKMPLKTYMPKCHLTASFQVNVGQQVPP